MVMDLVNNYVIVTLKKRGRGKEVDNVVLRQVKDWCVFSCGTEEDQVHIFFIVEISLVKPGEVVRFYGDPGAIGEPVWKFKHRVWRTRDHGRSKRDCFLCCRRWRGVNVHLFNCYSVT